MCWETFSNRMVIFDCCVDTTWCTQFFFGWFGHQCVQMAHKIEQIGLIAVCLAVINVPKRKNQTQLSEHDAQKVYGGRTFHNEFRSLIIINFAAVVFAMSGWWVSWLVWIPCFCCVASFCIFLSFWKLLCK